MIRSLTSLISLALLIAMPSSTLAQEASERPVVLGQVGLSFYAVVGGVVQELLEQQGYDVEVLEGPHAEIFPMLGRGEVDLLAAAWLPSGHATLYDPVRATPFEIAPIYENAAFFWAVPTYVPEDAIASIEDLKNPDVMRQLESRIVSLPEATGLTTGGRRVMEAYGLEDIGYEFVAGTPSEWLDALESAIEGGDWAVFPLWQPLWVTAAYDLRVLDEPQGAYGDPDTAYLIGHQDLRELLNSDALELLSKIRFEIGDVTEMDRLVNVDGLTPREAARRWINQNEATVAAWSD